VICPKCGEVNASNFLFCGMCGAILEAPRKARMPESLRPPASQAPVKPPSPPIPPPRPAQERVPPISGPSMLGLNQPSPDALRENAFSGMDSFFEPYEPKRAGRRILKTLFILALLGGGAWWGYSHGYIKSAWWKEIRKPQATNPTAGTAPAPTEPPVAKPTQEAKNAPPAEPAAPASQTVPPSDSPDTKPAEATRAPAEAKPARNEQPANPAKLEKHPKAAPLHARNAKPAVAPKEAPQAEADSGDAIFRKGEAYLYGRGVKENCDQAMRYLKSASDQSHAKARSALGTMYATGHCVPRDLPTSYRWFALALQADPNNSILEKDLSAVWNQMTPPERQLATKLRQ
jgi:Sel1 repeat